MKKLTFIEEMFSSNRAASSKRVIGTFCIIIYIFTLILSFIGLNITAVQATLLTGLLYVGGGLLGVTVMEGFGSNTYGYGGYSSLNQTTLNDNPDNMEESK